MSHINRFSATQGNDYAKDKTLLDIDNVLRGGISVDVSNPIGITQAQPLETIVSAIVPIEVDNIVDVNIVSPLYVDFPPVIGITSNQLLDVYVSNQIEIPPVLGITSNQILDVNVSNQIEIPDVIGITSNQLLDVNVSNQIEIPDVIGITSNQILSVDIVSTPATFEENFFYSQFSGDNGTNFNFITPSAPTFTLGETNFIGFLPSNPAGISVQFVSTDATDTISGGSGAQTLLVEYYETSVSQTTTTQIVSMNGLTPTASISPFYRLKNVKVNTTGSSSFVPNGEITLFETGNPLNTYIGSMIINKALWMSSHIYFPPSNQTLKFDYTNYIINGGSYSRIKILRKGLDNIWVLVKRFDTEFDETHKINDILPSFITPNTGLDYVWSFHKPDNSGDFKCSVYVGYHYE